VKSGHRLKLATQSFCLFKKCAGGEPLQRTATANARQT
jgi:hypothetical protein